MLPESLRRVAPASADDAAAAIKRAAEAGATVRFAGGGTKSGWGNATPEPALELSTARLDAVREHNAGDFTAVVEAGVPLAEAQRRFAAADQMLALDPPLGSGEAATIGGVFATADAGPLRHRYGAPRDLIVGATLALADGTVARSGGKVIKNVAGYDLAKLFTGAFGTLGLIVDVSVRLHPLPEATATAAGAVRDPDALAVAASALAHSPLETDALDLRWSEGRGAVLARFGGAAASDQARAAMRVLELSWAAVEADVTETGDDRIWAEQRAGQRTGEGCVIKVSGLQTRLADIVRAAEHAGGSLVGRAGHALCWVTLPAAEPGELAAAIGRLRAELAPLPCVVFDAPEPVRSQVDVWGEDDPARLALSRRLKQRFDPANTCNPGLFVGGV